MPTSNTSSLIDKANASNVVILGLDPGLADTGFGCIRKNQNTLTVLEYGNIKTKKHDNFPARLQEISLRISNVIDTYKPDYIAVEEIFFYKNVKTAMNVGQARGAILLTCQRYQIPIFEYTPLEIKQAIVGYGRAEKHQIQEMVKIILRMKVLPKPDDAADAIACAICCAHSLPPHLRLCKN